MFRKVCFLCFALVGMNSVSHAASLVKLNETTSDAKYNYLKVYEVNKPSQANITLVSENDKNIISSEEKIQFQLVDDSSEADLFFYKKSATETTSQFYRMTTNSKLWCGDFF